MRPVRSVLLLAMLLWASFSGMAQKAVTRLRCPASFSEDQPYRLAQDRFVVGIDAIGRIGIPYSNNDKQLAGLYQERALFQPQVGVTADIPLKGRSWITAGIALSQHAHGLRLQQSDANGKMFQAVSLRASLFRFSVGYSLFLSPKLRLTFSPELVYGTYSGLNEFSNDHYSAGGREYHQVWSSPVSRNLIGGAVHLCAERQLIGRVHVLGYAQVDFFDTAPLLGTLESTSGNGTTTTYQSGSNPKLCYLGLGVSYKLLRVERAKTF